MNKFENQKQKLEEQLYSVDELECEYPDPETSKICTKIRERILFALEELKKNKDVLK